MKPKKWPFFVTSIKREFQPDSFGLDYSRPSRFCKSQWHCSGSTGCVAVYLAFKWVVVVYLVTGMLVNLVDLSALEEGLDWPLSFTHRAKWFIYLTNWASLILTAQAIMAAILATDYLFSQDKSGNNMTKLHKCYWLLNNLSNVASPAITVLYWTSVYNKDVHRLDFGNIHGHIMNSVLVVVDLLVTAHPVRLLHFIQPVGLAVTYTLFSFLYFCSGGTNKQGDTKIYPFLNWSKPEVAMAYIFCASILLVMIHLVMWMLYQLRRFIALQLGTLFDPEENKPSATGFKITAVHPLDLEKHQSVEITNSKF